MLLDGEAAEKAMDGGKTGKPGDLPMSFYCF
jgi:hypothetical protein